MLLVRNCAGALGQPASLPRLNYLNTQSQPMKCSKNKAFRDARSACFSDYRH
jgi:hypothetical protein